MIRFLRAPIDYLRKASFDEDSPFEGDWEDLFDESSIQSRSSPILRKHILHPALIVLSAESEICDKMRWMKHDAADVTAECSSLYLGSWNRPDYQEENHHHQHQQERNLNLFVNSSSTPMFNHSTTSHSNLEGSVLKPRERIGSDEIYLDPSTSPRINRFAGRGGASSRGHSHQRSTSSQSYQSSSLNRPAGNSMTPYQGVRPTVDADQILSTYATLRSGAPLPPLGAAAAATVPATSASTSFPPPPIFGISNNDNHHHHQSNINATRMNRSSTWSSLPPIQSGVLTNASLQQQFLSNLPHVKRSGLAAPVVTAPTSSTSSSGSGPTSTPPSPTMKSEEPTGTSRRNRNRSGSLSSILSHRPNQSISSNASSSSSTSTQYASVPHSNLFSTPLISTAPTARNHFIHPLSSSLSSNSLLHQPQNNSHNSSPLISASHNNYAQSNATASPQMRPLRNEIYTELSYLQRENLLLRNELNFELYLKEQHLRHIGRLHRDRISDTALEAERQNLYQNVRSLRNQLNNAISLQERQRNETIRSNSRQVNWTNELNFKLKNFREEKKNWLNEIRESRAKIETAEGIIKDQSNRLQELGSDLFEKETELNSIKPKISKLKSYEEKISQLSTCLSYWDQDVRKFEEQRKEMEILLGRWKEMEFMLDSSEEALRLELSQKDQMERKLERLENELRIAGIKIQDLSKEKNKRQFNLSNPNQMKFNSKDELQPSENSSSILQDENQKMRSKIEMLSANLQDMASKVDSLEAEKSYQNARLRLINQDKHQFKLNQSLVDINNREEKISVSAPGSGRIGKGGMEDAEIEALDLSGKTS